MKKKCPGIVAAGHIETAKVAQLILENGGNAFDAVVAAHFAACVTEPVLASLGGGGFLLARSAQNSATLVYDFFAQTPKNVCPEMDFYPIYANFGPARQEFHIGLGSAATPGSLMGMAEIHQDLCSMPMKELLQPAIDLARNGVELNQFQAYLLHIIQPILAASAEATEVFVGEKDTQGLIKEGTHYKLLALANTLAYIQKVGIRCFCQGEFAQLVDDVFRGAGGLLRAQDIQQYQVMRRTPLVFGYQQAKVTTNPPPSSGGTLIGIALRWLACKPCADTAFATAAYYQKLVQAIHITNLVRDNVDKQLNNITLLESFLTPAETRSLQQILQECAVSRRGTTHISVIDGHRNAASLTLSNGEGCGHVLPNTGIMLNNMLGEQDLNPNGFFNFQTDQRMTSMMAPTILDFPDDRLVVLGSGGSNRIRSAIMQVILNLVHTGMPLKAAVSDPRLHFEDDILHLEPGFSAEIIQSLQHDFAKIQHWDTQNLYFGGVHTVMQEGNHYSGYGDPRRGGHALMVEPK